MKTRRKSKAAAAAAAQGAATRENSPAVFTVEIPEDIDFESLTAQLPDVNLANPSPETIAAIYRFFVEQVEQTEFVQRELEETRADIERKDVELDQAIQDRETATSGMETVLDRVQKELSQVKQEKDALGAWLRRVTISVLTVHVYSRGADTTTGEPGQPVDNTIIVLGRGPDPPAACRGDGTREARSHGRG